MINCTPKSDTRPWGAVLFMLSPIHDTTTAGAGIKYYRLRMSVDTSEAM